MELAIDPEPTPEEHAAIAAALERVGLLATDAPSEWGRPELEDELPERPTAS